MLRATDGGAGLATTRIASPVWWMCILMIVVSPSMLVRASECDDQLTVLFVNLKSEEPNTEVVSFPQLDPLWLSDVAAVIDATDADITGITGVAFPSVLSSLSALLSTECGYLHLSTRTQDLDSSVGFLSTVPVPAAGRTGSTLPYPIPSSTLSCSNGTSSLSANGWIMITLEEFSVVLFVADFIDGPLDCASAAQREAQAVLLQQEVYSRALQKGYAAIVMGAFDDYDGRILDASGNRPISRVLSLLKDADPSAPGTELFNIAELLPVEQRFTTDRETGREQTDFVLISESLRNRVLNTSMIRSEVVPHALISLSLAPSLNAEPIAINDSYTVGENQSLSVRVPGVLENDSDADNDPLEAVLVAEPTLGRVTLETDGSFTYIPDFGVSGSDSFVYSVSDGIRDSNAARVSITIEPLAYARLQITEVEINPSGLDSGREWVEIFNPTDGAVGLAGWSITDTYHQTIVFIDSGSVSVLPNSYYVYSFDQLALANEGNAAIRLLAPDGVPVDQTPVLRDTENDPRTWQRFDTELDPPWSALWVLREATRGIENGPLQESATPSD